MNWLFTRKFKFRLAASSVRRGVRPPEYITDASHQTGGLNQPITRNFWCTKSFDIIIFVFLLGPGISPLTIQQFSRLGTLQIYLSFTYLVSEWLEHGIPKAVDMAKIEACVTCRPCWQRVAGWARNGYSIKVNNRDVKWNEKLNYFSKIALNSPVKG